MAGWADVARCVDLLFKADEQGDLPAALSGIPSTRVTPETSAT
jgi:hypothetical protein